MIHRSCITLSVAMLLLLCTNTAEAKNFIVPIDAKTISAALVTAAPGDTVWLEDGTYHENIMLPPGVTLCGRTPYRAIIDGKGRGTVISLAKNNTIFGLDIRNGTIGVFSNGAGNIIKGCRIIRNWQTGIICVRQLPLIEDNIIAYNRGSGIQGWDVRATSASINHNTIAYNSNHGIAMGGSADVVIENNLVVWNERFGIKLSPTVERSRITGNDFYGNLVSTALPPPGNHAFDPMFISPRIELNFAPDPAHCCKVMDIENNNLGARPIY